MDSISTLLSAPYVPFATAILLLFGIGLLEVIGLGFSALEVDIHHEVDTDSTFDVLGWLGIGHVPLMAVLVSFLTLFGLAGMIEQNVAEQFLSGPLSLWFAVPGALVVSLPLTGVSARFLGSVLPNEETTAIGSDALLGKRATVVLGSARKGSPTKAQITDHFGQSHYIMVEPDMDEVSEGDELILVRIEGDVFIGTAPYSSMRSIT